MYTANTNQHKPMYCNSTCHTYIIIQYIEHISSQHINPYQLISATHTLYYCNIYLIIQLYIICIHSIHINLYTSCLSIDL